MSVGLPRDKPSIDAKAGSLATGLNQYLRECSAFHAMLSDTNVFANDQALKDMGYSQDDVDHLRGTFAAFKHLDDVAHNRSAQPVADDLFFFAKYLTGLVF